MNCKLQTRLPTAYHLPKVLRIKKGCKELLKIPGIGRKSVPLKQIKGKEKLVSRVILKGFDEWQLPKDSIYYLFLAWANWLLCQHPCTDRFSDVILIHIRRVISSFSPPPHSSPPLTSIKLYLHSGFLPHLSHFSLFSPSPSHNLCVFSSSSCPLLVVLSLGSFLHHGQDHSYPRPSANSLSLYACITAGKSERERAAKWHLRAVLSRMSNPSHLAPVLVFFSLHLLRGLVFFIWQSLSYRVLPAGTPIVYQEKRYRTLPAAFSPIPLPPSIPSTFELFPHLVLFSPNLPMLLLICSCTASLHYPSFTSISFLCFFLHNLPSWFSMNLLI